VRARIVLSCLALGSCALLSARDELGAMMQKEVGKTLDDPEGYRAQHPKLRIGARKLANGNTEEEYRAGFRDQCPVFFEVERASGRVIGWHFGQPDDDCILGAPPLPDDANKK
jgi:hypothetical protein